MTSDFYPLVLSNLNPRQCTYSNSSCLFVQHAVWNPVRSRFRFRYASGMCDAPVGVGHCGEEIIVCEAEVEFKEEGIMRLGGRFLTNSKVFTNCTF